MKCVAVGEVCVVGAWCCHLLRGMASSSQDLLAQVVSLMARDRGPRARDHRDGENGDVPHGPTVPCRVSSRRSEPDRLRVALRLRAGVEFEGTRVGPHREEEQRRVGMPRVL